VSAQDELPERPALERLAVSRERMRQSMRAVMPRPKESHLPGELPAWLDKLQSIPGVSLVVDAVRSWWAHHPMRVATLVAADAGKTVIRPFAQRHPIGLVVGALVVGGLIAWARPWRGYLKPALFVGLLPQLASKVMAQIPVESWMAVLNTLTQPAPAPAAAESKPEPKPEPQSSETPTPTPAHATVASPPDPSTLH
jgi:hypothetical protein